MRTRWLGGAAATLAMTWACAAPAQALTVGSAELPPGAEASDCGNTGQVYYSESGADPSFTIPAAGLLTSWSKYLVDAEPGDVARFLVLRPSGSSFTIVGAETATIGALPPNDGVATYSLETPLPVQAGDRLAVGYSDSACYFFGDAVPPDQTLNRVEDVDDLTPGTTFPAGEDASPSGFQLNLAAEIDTQTELALAAEATPKPTIAGQLATLTATATNPSGNDAPATISSTVPAGLAIDRAVVGGGGCTVTGQDVTCTTTVPAAGSAPMVVLVRPAAAGSYAFAASLTSAFDNTPANNTASATLDVVAAGGPVVTVPGPVVTVPAPVAPVAAAPCVVPRLKGTPAKVARDVLRKLGCGAAKTRKARSRTVRKGLVIKTTPRAGQYAAGRKVALVVSSGKPKAKRKRG